MFLLWLTLLSAFLSHAFIATPRSRPRHRLRPNPRLSSFRLGATAESSSDATGPPPVASQQERNAESSSSSSSSSSDLVSICLSKADPAVNFPLPKPYTQCPFNGIVGGPQSFYRVASKALRFPSLFSFLHKDQPTVDVSGGKHVRQLLQQEFTALESNAFAGVSQLVCGTQSLRTTQDPAEHRTLRKLVGVPLSPAAVDAAVPRLQAICQKRIDDMLVQMPAGSTVKAIAVTQAMALDVTWQQVLGLDLQSDKEIHHFHEQAYHWLQGIYHKPGTIEFQQTLEARAYLVKAIEKKIQQLKQAGESDGSTVGGLLYATLEEADETMELSGNRRTLTEQEVIDNALLLILAATETTSSNLANAILLMGLHPDTWQRVVDEQETVVTQYGTKLTREILEDHCPYLDAVIQETLRILPVTLVSRRRVAKTLVIDGQQIPQGWAVSYNIFLTHQRDPSVVSSSDSGTSVHDPMDLLHSFAPARWLDRRTRPRSSQDNFIPFGAGPRQCPGRLLAQTKMKTFLALWARSVRYELAPPWDAADTPVESQIVWEQLRSVPIPQDGVQIRLH